MLVILTVVRLLVASGTALSPDEAYYRVWSLALAPGFLDHPPGVALLIRAGTALAGPDALGVRLGAPLLALAGAPLLASAGRDLLGLAPDRALGAALLFNATLMVGVGAVTITPDTPLLSFWGATLAACGRAIRTGRSRWMASAGLLLGLGFCCKYTAILLLVPIAVSFGAHARTRALLCRPGTAIGVALGLGAVAPVIGWNAAHGWASFAKQGGRAGVAHWARAPRYLGELVGGQIGLATPLIAILAAIGTWQLARRARRDPGALLVVLATVLPLAVFVEHALGDRVQANWPCVIYPSAALAAAAATTGERRRWTRSLLSRPVAIALGLTLTLGVYAQALFHPLPLRPKLDATAARLGGWGALARDVRAADASFGLPVVADEYGLAAELAWEGAAPSVGAVGPRWQLFRLPPLLRSGTAVLLIRRADAHPTPTVERRRWATIRLVGTLARRDGAVAVGRYDLLVAVAAMPPPSSARLPVRSP